MNKRYAYFLIQLILLMFSCSVIAATESNSTLIKNSNRVEVKAVKVAALVYAINNSGYREFNIVVNKIVGNYAKITASPIGPGDSATIYMKKVNGEWIGIDIGTGIDPNDLDIPEEVF